MISALRSWLQNRLARRLGVPQVEWGLELLRQQGFSPSLVFDAGAYRGEFAHLCRRLWPAAEVTCFEVLPRAVEHLQGLRRRDAAIHVCPFLLGATEKNSVVLHEAETASSVLEEHVNKGHPAASYPMTTVDSAASRLFPGRTVDLLKLDVQGYELEVLKGAAQSLGQVQVILAEVNLLDIHAGVPLLAELVAWLDARAFVAFDICGLTRRPLDRALWQTDMVFVPRRHALRSDKRWGTGP
jgi:FkbM family methyltransferase